jgi:hypothetical protein
MIENHETFVKKYKIDKAPKGTIEYDANLFIESHILLEFQNKVIYLNGDNNKQKLKELSNEIEVKIWMHKYQSTGWVIIRGAWFFDYLATLTHNIVTNKEWKLSQCGQEAYVEKL